MSRENPFGTFGKKVDIEKDIVILKKIKGAFPMDKTLFAPWRIGYILQKKRKGCLFCLIAREKKDRENLILERGKRCFVVLNRFPYNNGHLMVVPYAHKAGLEELEDKVLLDLLMTAAKYVKKMKKVMRAEGFNIGINIGPVAGAGVAHHLHLHLVPRWTGDRNFMPVIGGTKVLSESFESVYNKLRK